MRAASSESLRRGVQRLPLSLPGSRACRAGRLTRTTTFRKGTGEGIPPGPGLLRDHTLPPGSKFDDIASCEAAVEKKERDLLIATSGPRGSMRVEGSQGSTGIRRRQRATGPCRERVSDLRSRMNRWSTSGIGAKRRGTSGSTAFRSKKRPPCSSTRSRSRSTTPITRSKSRDSSLWVSPTGIEWCSLLIGTSVKTESGSRKATRGERHGYEESHGQNR